MKSIQRRRPVAPPCGLAAKLPLSTYELPESEGRPAFNSSSGAAFVTAPRGHVLVDELNIRGFQSRADFDPCFVAAASMRTPVRGVERARLIAERYSGGDVLAVLKRCRAVLIFDVV